MAQDAAAYDRLREFLRQLPPDARAKLLSKFEGVDVNGDDAAIATLVLRELKAVDSPPIDSRPDIDVSAVLFRCLEPFLIDRNKGAMCPGQIDRASLVPIWRLIETEILPGEVAKLRSELAEADRNDAYQKAESITRKFQIRIADAIGEAMNSATESSAKRHLQRMGLDVAEDIALIRVAFKNREVLDAFQSRLPSNIKNMSVDQAAAFLRIMDIPSLQSPQVLPLAMTLILRRLQTTQHLVRLAIAAAQSDDAAKVSATPYGVAVTIVLNEMGRQVALLRAILRGSSSQDVRLQLKSIHDGVRGLRTELDIRPESPWGRQLSAIRAEISGFLQSELESASGRVRRLLRPPRDGVPATRIDSIDVDETARLVELVIVCRDYASELALNEVSQRTYSDLQQYLESASNALVERLRIAKPQDFESIQSQISAALRFCHIMFGPEFAATLSKAADVALHAERKAKRA